MLPTFETDHKNGLHNGALVGSCSLCEKRDTSTPSRPALVIERPALKQTSVFKPTGGLLVSFRFTRDAEQYAESLYEYVSFKSIK